MNISHSKHAFVWWIYFTCRLTIAWCFQQLLLLLFLLLLYIAVTFRLWRVRHTCFFFAITFTSSLFVTSKFKFIFPLQLISYQTVNMNVHFIRNHFGFRWKIYPSHKSLYSDNWENIVILQAFLGKEQCCIHTYVVDRSKSAGTILRIRNNG